MKPPAAPPCSPVTGANDVVLVGQIKVADLLPVARRKFGDFSYLFRGIETLNLWRCSASGVKFFEPMVCGDGPFYEMLNKAAWYYLDEKREYAVAARYVKSGDRVLDVGCGTGGFAAHVPDGAVFRGLELSLSGVARASHGT